MEISEEISGRDAGLGGGAGDRLAAATSWAELPGFVTGLLTGTTRRFRAALAGTGPWLGPPGGYRTRPGSAAVDRLYRCGSAPGAGVFGSVEPHTAP